VDGGLRTVEWSAAGGLDAPGPLFGPPDAAHLTSADVNRDGFDDLIVAGDVLVFGLLAEPAP
jgi:hypothetical protein